jgi:hypothetical protein
MGGLYQRTTLQMHRLAYFLVLLLISAQVDNFWAAAVLPSAPLAEDDEYLPPQQRPQEKECSPHQEPVFVGLKPPTADLPLVRRGVPSEWNRTTLFSPAPLYVFMSLQI